MGKRDVWREVLEGVREIKTGGGHRIDVEVPDIKTVRARAGLSQEVFAGLMGISRRTLQEWEQGRRRPTGPALALLRIVDANPRALLPPRPGVG